MKFSFPAFFSEEVKFMKLSLLTFFFKGSKFVRFSLLTFFSEEVKFMKFSLLAFFFKGSKFREVFFAYFLFQKK